MLPPVPSPDCLLAVRAVQHQAALAKPIDIGRVHVRLVEVRRLGPQVVNDLRGRARWHGRSQPASQHGVRVRQREQQRGTQRSEPVASAPQRWYYTALSAARAAWRSCSSSACAAWLVGQLAPAGPSWGADWHVSQRHARSSARSSRPRAGRG